jgi:hypothetical protein
MRSQAYFLWDAYRYASTESITPDAIIGPQLALESNMIIRRS